jgi:hypothetical protein
MNKLYFSITFLFFTLSSLGNINSPILPSCTPPVADDPADAVSCGSYTLSTLTAGNHYWTGSGATGTEMFALDVISSTTVLYVYKETGTTPNCTDENSFAITIHPNVPASVSISADTTEICDGTTVNFTATSSNGGLLADMIYCTSGGNSAADEWIASVQIDTFTNASNQASGYSDHTNQTITIAPGVIPITLSPGYAGTAYAEYWKIWVDFNLDGDFDDAGELLFDAGGLSTIPVSGNITIPTSALGKITRLRVSMKYNAEQTGHCENFDYGEVEDYSISIANAWGFPPYCPVNHTVNDEWIATVQIGAFTNTSDQVQSAGGYSDYTNQTIALATGLTPLTLSPGYAGAVYDEYWKVWADWNIDGDFDDNGELLFDSGGLSNIPVSGNITIPASAEGKTVRLRVAMKYNAAQTGGCEAFAYGETEDYIVCVKAATAPLYQWKIGATNVGTNSSTFSSNTLVNGNVVSVVMTSLNPCSTNSTATSNEVTISVNPNLFASVSINADATEICEGTTVNFVATPTNGGATPSYQWKIGTTNVGTDAPIFASSTLTEGDLVTVVMTSNASLCIPNSPVTSNGIAMLVNSNVSISADATEICEGTTVNFTATPTNAGTTQSYQWKVGVLNVGTNSPTFSSNTLADGDIVTVTMASNSPCPTNSPATSNAISIVVNADLPASVSVIADATTICAGTAVNFTATPSNGGTNPSYQWKIGTTNVGTDSPSFASDTLTNVDVITVVMTRNYTCGTNAPATSNAINMTVNPILEASVFVVSDGTTICMGDTVNFTATPVNGGISPSYQWRVGTTMVGTDSPNFASSSLVDGDAVSVIMTSNASPCLVNTTDTSSGVIITINPANMTSVSIVSNVNPICYGTMVDFTATPTNVVCSRALNYCNSNVTSSTNEWISKVQIDTFANASGQALGYSDFTDQVIHVTSGVIPLTLTPGFSGSALNEYWKVWVDLNADGDFDDAGELLYDAGGINSGPVSGNITIPASAIGKMTRLRVSMKYDTAQTGPCETFNFGEVEDYTISIELPGGIGQYCPSSSAYWHDGGSNAIETWIDFGLGLGWQGFLGYPTGYHDNTDSEKIHLCPGENNITLKIKDSYSLEDNYHWKIWVDLNVDGDFDDIGELLYDTSYINVDVSWQSSFAQIDVPPSAVGKLTRMRVTAKLGGPIVSPCEVFEFGEVYDFAVLIKPSPNYQWIVVTQGSDTINVGMNSPLFSSDTLIHGDSVWVEMTSQTTCTANPPATSNVISMSVNQASQDSTDVQAACDSYTWIDGNTYTASNNTATWVETNAVGCDSLVTLDLTITISNTGTDVQTACDSYTWIDGNTYTASNNTATWLEANAGACDKIITLDLTINSNAGTDVQAACDSYTWIDGNTYTASNNTATWVETNAVGCDSLVTLNLTITNSNAGTDVQAACDGYTWIDGTTYTASNNTATWVETNAVGCDSLVTLNLTITNSNAGTDVQAACDGYTWIDGTTYTASNNTATWLETNAVGCDSLVTLNLTITNSNAGTDVQAACDSYTWIDGNTYTASNNTATWVETNAVGCDSLVTLNLTITDSNAGTDVQAACDSYTWIDGTTYTASNNTATWVETNAVGCDSLVTLNLTITNSNAGTDVQAACDSYTWIDGTTYTASNNTATWVETNAGGCDSLVTLNLTITNSNAGTDLQAACDSYTWIDGNTYTASNNTATWVETNAVGCDSLVTLNLTITDSNAGTDVQAACDSYTWIDGTTYTASNNTATWVETNAVGCDSLVTLNLTITNSNAGTDVQAACDSYTWIDGTTYTASNNTATWLETNAGGCDSLVTLNLTITNSNAGTDVQMACDSYTWIDGTTYTASNNTATWLETNAGGCDSLVTLNLTITNSNAGTDVQAACDSYTWIDGTTYTASNNTATWLETNAVGCDSIVTLDLTINSNAGTDVQMACDTYTWIDGTTYTASNNSATWLETNAGGCDSLVTLDLTITNSNAGTDVQMACDSYTWIDGTTYTASNNSATWLETNAGGCDSLVTLNLTITNSNAGTDVQMACDSYTWIDGNTYTFSNNSATWTYTNSEGCDSVVTLDLTINSFIITASLLNDLTITADQTGDSYQWIDCSNGNQSIQGDTSQLFTATLNGDYAVVVTNGNCSDTSNCITIDNVAIDDIRKLEGLIIYPNPSYDGIFYIDNHESIIDLVVYDALGRVVKVNYQEANGQINCMTLAPGKYTVKLVTNVQELIRELIILSN